MSDISLKNEIIRKAIHLFTSIIPIYYYFEGDRDQMLILCGILFITFVSGELLVKHVTKMRQIHDIIFARLLRGDEHTKKFNGATLLFLGFFLSVWLFNKDIAVIAMLLLSVSDSLAAIVGKTIKSRKLFSKTVAGSLAFFTISLIIMINIYENLNIIIITALIATIVELVPLPVNDNISIPLASGAFLTLIKVIA